MDQPGKVANPARGQLNRENNIPLSPCVPENLVSRDGFSRPVPRQPAHLHTQAESGAYLRDSSRVPRRRPFICLKPPCAIGSVPSLSGHATAYRWRSLPRVGRHRSFFSCKDSKNIFSVACNSGSGSGSTLDSCCCCILHINRSGLNHTQ